MTRNIPAWAQELLDGAQPGPWEVIKEYTDGEPRPYDSHRICTESGVYMGIMHGQVAPLAAAAPDLAETVAGMTCEYTVYVYSGDRIIMQCGFEDDEVAGWTDNFTVAAYLRESLIEDGRDARLVRRLVTDVEVIE